MDFDRMLQAFAAAAVRGDGDGLADLFTDDGTYVDYFFGAYSGRDAIKKMLAHFGEGGRDFRWEFSAPAHAGDIAYASYKFSFASKRPEAKGARVVFDGIAKFELAGGKIRRYSEVFDRGMALAQQAFEPERLVKIGQRYAAQLKEQPDWSGHVGL